MPAMRVLHEYGEKRALLRPNPAEISTFHNKIANPPSFVTISSCDFRMTYRIAPLTFALQQIMSRSSWRRNARENRPTEKVR
jgi:hypothetical protein